MTNFVCDKIKKGSNVWLSTLDYSFPIIISSNLPSVNRARGKYHISRVCRSWYTFEGEGVCLRFFWTSVRAFFTDFTPRRHGPCLRIYNMVNTVLVIDFAAKVRGSALFIPNKRLNNDAAAAVVIAREGHPDYTSFRVTSLSSYPPSVCVLLLPLSLSLSLLSSSPLSLSSPNSCGVKKRHQLKTFPKIRTAFIVNK